MYRKESNIMAFSSLRLALPALLFLVPALPAEDLKPEAILDKYIEATGGHAAYDKIKSEIETGTGAAHHGLERRSDRVSFASG